MTGRSRRAAWGSLLLLSSLLAVVGCSTTEGPDPYQGANRGVFGFNEGVDRYFLEPVATGWDFVVPERAQWGVTNFFANLGMPLVLLNDLLQAKPIAASQDVARFVVNTTVGVAGIVDVASRLEIPSNDEDFGQTLGRYGVPAGPYVVLPLFGPSTIRDTLGFVVDGVSSPHVYFVPAGISAGAQGVNVVNLRARYLEDVRDDRATALDYYVFVRNAYLQNRERKVTDAAEPPPDERNDELYHLEDGEDGP